jgi:hypothetical protein
LDYLGITEICFKSKSRMILAAIGDEGPHLTLIRDFS